MSGEDLTSPDYRVVRDTYWEAQRLHRESSVVEIIRLMPAGIDAVLLQISDTPRLALHCYIDTDGDKVSPSEYEDEGKAPEGTADAIDQLANDMEAFSWEEADSFLMGEGDGETFVIERPGDINEREEPLT